MLVLQQYWNKGKCSRKYSASARRSFKRSLLVQITVWQKGFEKLNQNGPKMNSLDWKGSISYNQAAGALAGSAPRSRGPCRLAGYQGLEPFKQYHRCEVLFKDLGGLPNHSGALESHREPISRHVLEQSSSLCPAELCKCPGCLVQGWCHRIKITSCFDPVFICTFAFILDALGLQ